MSMNNWSRFAGGKKSSGMQRVSKSKKAPTSVAGAGKKSAKAPKSKRSPKRAANQVDVSISKEQARWRAEDDARTLQRASEILEDKTRVAKAKKIAEEQAKAAEEAAKAIRQL